MKNFILCVVLMAAFIVSSPASAQDAEQGCSNCQGRGFVVKMVPMKDVLSKAATVTKKCLSAARQGVADTCNRARCIMEKQPVRSFFVDKKPVRSFLGNLPVPTVKSLRCR